MSPREAMRGVMSHWPAISAVFVAAVGWGSATAEIQALKDRVTTVSDNRDRLIRIEEQVRGLREDLNEVRLIKEGTRGEVDVLRGIVTELSTRFDVTTDRILEEVKLLREGRLSD